MENFEKTNDTRNLVEQAPTIQPQSAQESFKINVMLRKLRGSLLLIIGYLLSPLCWWNDLFFNLPVAYFFGFICSLLSPNLLVPCSIVGYWLSNVAGILLMQVGTVDVFQKQTKERSFKKDLFTGLASSTVYTFIIMALMQFDIIHSPISAEINVFSSWLHK